MTTAKEASNIIKNIVKKHRCECSGFIEMTDGSKENVIVRKPYDKQTKVRK